MLVQHHVPTFGTTGVEITLDLLEGKDDE
jgi:hypothetical protein